MKKKKILLISLVISVIFVGLVAKYRSRSTLPQQEAVWVQASVVKETSLPLETQAIGTLVARSVEITPDVAEHVSKILFQDGTFVKQGAVLIQLDDTEYKAKYASAKAKLIYNEGDFKRLAALAKKSFLSKRDIDKAEADLKESRADAEQIESILNKMKLTAPFDGMVGKSKVNPGDYAVVGQSIVTLTDTKHLRVEYNVPEKYFPLLKRGQDVNITTSTYPGRTFIGKLSFISPTINTDNRSVSLYADVPNDDNALSAGMFVKVTQFLGNANHILMVPARSLVPVLDGEQVYKIVNGKAQAVNVTTGKRTEKNVEIIKGLLPGDNVITDGQLKIQNGVPVKVKN